MKFAIFATLLLVGAVHGDPLWSNLKVTWSLNPFNFWAFNTMPRDLSGKLGDFKYKDNQCTVPNAKFLGQRYWYKEDPAVILLYDVNGIIAGIQTSMPKTSYSPPTFQINCQLLDDGDYWTATAYFVDPTTICNGGRTKDQFEAEGTGTGLWLQGGPDPIKNSVLVPFTEDDAKKSTWKFGKCFKTMGNHYWYNITADMPCDHFVPNCLLYNGGKLTAFCFAVNASLPSNRYEHLTPDALKHVMDPVPKCFFTDPGYQKLSSIHVYFSDHPRVDTMC